IRMAGKPCPVGGHRVDRVLLEQAWEIRRALMLVGDLRDVLRGRPLSRNLDAVAARLEHARSDDFVLLGVGGSGDDRGDATRRTSTTPRLAPLPRRCPATAISAMGATRGLLVRGPWFFGQPVRADAGDAHATGVVCAASRRLVLVIVQPSV